MNSRILITSAALSLLSISYAENKTVDLTKAGILPGKSISYTQKINRVIERETASMTESDTLTLKFAPGHYNFHPDKSVRRELFISNHDQDNPKSIGLLLEKKNNLVIDGQSAELIFHGRMLPIAMIGCSNCTIENLNIDFEKPHIAQIKILENDTVNGIITYEPAPWVDYVIKNGTFSHRGEGWSMTPCGGIAFDGSTRHIVYKTSDISVGVQNVTDLGNRKIKAPWRNPALLPGTIVAMRTYERPAPGIFSDACSDICLLNVKVHYAEGMGLLAQNTHNITLNGFGVCLRGENDPRYFTTQADATHFSSCSGVIKSAGGLYEGMMDDAINVHGTYLKVTQRVDDRTLIGQYMHHQSYGFRWGQQGDSANIVASRTMEIACSGLTIASIEPVDKPTEHGAKQFRITFNQDLPTSINPDEKPFGIENLTATPAVYFSENTIRNNRARGALFSTPRTVVCENNLFDHTSGCAILLCGDCNGWFETGACRDVTIKGNRFVNALTNLFQFTNAVISIYPEIPDLEGQTQYFHSNVNITENHFETFDMPLLYAKSVNGLKFDKNTVVHTTDFIPFHWNDSQIWLERVNNARIQAVE